MTAKNRATLDAYFITGAKPTQAQFTNLIDSCLNLVDSASQSIASTVTFSSGNIILPGLTSGSVTVSVPAIAGATSFVLPPNNGTSGYFLRTDGAGTTTWVASSVSNPLPLGTNGGTGGSIILSGATSGTGTIAVPAIAGTSTNFTLPSSNGTSNQVLITDGSGNTSWTTPSSGGEYTLLTTTNANAAASISFGTTYINGSYTYYKVKISGLYSSVGGDDLNLTLSINNGGAYLSSNYAWLQFGAAGVTVINNSGSAAALINILPAATGPALTNAAVSPSAGEIYFSNLLVAAKPNIFFNMNVSGSSPGGCLTGNGSNTGNTAINAIKFAGTSGNLTGKFELWGGN